MTRRISGQLDSNASVSAANQDLRRAWRTGRAIHKKLGQTGQYGKHLVAQEAEKRQINEDLVRKLRQIADPKQGYTRKELDDLCRLCRQYRRAIGISFLIKFITIPKDQSQREEFQREAIAHRWSRAQIDLEIRARFGRRRQGGKKPMVAADRQGILCQLESLCTTLMRFFEVLQEPRASDGEIPALQLPPAIQRRVQKMIGEVAQLRQATTRVAARERSR